MDRRLFIFIHHIYIEAKRLGYSYLRHHPLLDKVYGNIMRSWLHYFERVAIRRIVENPVLIDGHRFFYRPEDSGSIISANTGRFESETYQTMFNILSSGMTMVDVGAHVGWYTLLGARLTGPSGYIYAFEAAPSTAELLQKNVLANEYSNVTVVNKAISHKRGKENFFIDDYSSGGSSLFISGREKNSIEVETISLDEFFQEEAWPPIHLVKIDIEGAEKLALEGMRELCRRNPQLKLIVEINLKAFSLEELLNTLQSCGFSRFRALELGKDLSISQDLPLVLAATRRLTVNLFCQK
jgi:FkbM family methyltransferase